MATEASTGGGIADHSGLLLVAGLAAVAFVVGQVTRQFVSEVIVFLGLGIIAGPDLLGLVDAETVQALDPVVALALGAIVFGLGERLELPLLRQIRHTLSPIAVLENVAVFGLCLVGPLAVGVDFATAFLLAAIALSTSPTTLVAVINERRAGGTFTDHVLSATAINNIVSALVYGLGLPLVLATRSAGGAGEGVIAFAQVIVASLVIGGVGAWVLRRWMHTVHRAGERLLFVAVVLIGIVAVSRAVAAPVVLTTLIAGAVLANDPRDTGPLFDSLRTLEAPIFLVFFLVAGAGVHLDELATVGWAGAAYVLARGIGKVAGGWIGADVTRSGRRAGWGPWVGAGLMPFAGMAIGLAAFTLERASAAGLEALGSDVSAIVLGSVVIFELLGPISVGRALDATGDTGRVAPTDTDSLEVEQPHLVRHILLPISSLRMARRKAPQVVDLAASTGATLTGLHVIPPGSELDPHVGDPALSYVRQVAQTRNVRFEPIVREAESVVDAIVEESRAGAVDLVLLGEPLPGRFDRGLGRRIVHTVADRLDEGVRLLIVPTTLDEPLDRATLTGDVSTNPRRARSE